jgi:hypothetical protein
MNSTIFKRPSMLQLLVILLLWQMAHTPVVAIIILTFKVKKSQFAARGDRTLALSIVCNRGADLFFKAAKKILQLLMDLPLAGAWPIEVAASTV